MHPGLDPGSTRILHIFFLDSAVAFHWIKGDVELDGKTYRTGVTVLEDARGNKFYNFNEDLAKQEGRRLTYPSNDRGRDLNNIMADGGDDVNLTLSN